MCGIAGAIVFDDWQLSEDYLLAMRDSMIHRGPDGAGIWLSPQRKVGLAHRRLSIIDLSSNASQPMTFADERYCLTFNGEIYNHAELRQELQQLGHQQWQTDHSDTEVVLRAFAQWGIACVEKFRGMFAFAIWDAQQQTLWLVRDRIGIKPLYYSVHHNRLTFASEIKALLTDPQQPRAVNEQALFHYLSFLTTPAPQTLFAGINKLPNGTWLKVTANGDIQQQRYWDVWDHVKPLTQQSDDDIADQVLEELRTAVNYRKVGDVPMGVFLSGGIDSSTNAALFSAGETQPINTFSIGYDHDYASYQNELHHAKAVAQMVNANYHEKLLTVDDLLAFLPEMIRLQDEPIGDPVCVPVYYVSKLAREQGTIVCQVGEGADELFCGYPSWKIKWQLQQYNNLPATGLLKRGLLSMLHKMGKGESIPYELLRRGVNDVPIFWGGAEAFTYTQKHQLLAPRLQQQFKDYSSWEAIKPLYQHFQQRAWQPSTLNWMSYIDLNLRLPELLLMRVDKMSMGVSLEARVPFLDHKFVELAMSIPSEVKFRHKRLKHILKHAVRNVIPANIINRKKQGFGVPVHEWLLDRLGAQASQQLNNFCDQCDLLDKRKVQQFIAHNKGHQVWYLLNLALWWQEYIA